MTDVSNHRAPSIWDDVPLTRRQYYFREALDDLIRNEKGLVTAHGIYMIREAVSTTLMEHPELDPDEVKPHSEWRKGT